MNDSLSQKAVAAVILNWNGLGDTVSCLDSLLGQNDAAGYLPVVVDNGSRDGSLGRLRAWAEGAGVSVAQHTRAEAEGLAAQRVNLSAVASGRKLALIDAGNNLGFAAGANLGLRYALSRGYPQVLFLNNDVTLEPGVVGALAASLARHPTWAGVAPKVLDRDVPDRVLYAGGKVRLWQARAVHIGRFAADGPAWAGERETGHLTLCCALYRADVLRAAGLLDERFFFGQEDVALSITARRLGHVLGVQLDAVVHHAEGRSLEGQPERSVYYFNKYRVLLLARYGRWWQIVAGTVFLATTRIPKLAWLLLRGRVRIVRAEMRAYRDALAGRFGDHDREVARRGD